MTKASAVMRHELCNIRF